MRPITMMQAQWKKENANGTSLNFEYCKGGYFSLDKEYALKVVGRSLQNGAPTTDKPIYLRCVRAGSKIKCGDSEIITPCDLYEGDLYYPASGIVQRRWMRLELDGSENWAEVTGTEMKCYAFTHSGFRSGAEGFCSHYAWTSYNEFGKKKGFYSHNTVSLNIIDDVIASVDSFKGWLVNQRGLGTPVTFYGNIVDDQNQETFLTEQYMPQNIYGLSGTVLVTQEEAEEEASLSAMMLVRR